MKTEARKLWESGFNVIPTKDKICLLPAWGQWKERRQTKEEFEALKITDQFAVVSGFGVFCIDIDSKNDKSGLTGQFMSMIHDQDPEMPTLYYEQTPSGGYHIVGKCSMPCGNVKLCNDTGMKEACIETKGDGGYFVCAPSTGYKRMNGDLADLETLTPDQLEMIMDTARSLSQKEVTEYQVHIREGVSVLDDYDLKHDGNDIINMLVDHGWKIFRKKGEITQLTRPGKERTPSATVNRKPDRLWVFSTSTEFETQRYIKPSAVLCILEYGGDFSACAKDLYRQGYGVKSETIKTEVVKLAPAKLSNLGEKILEFSKGKFDRGLQTGWKALFEHYRVSDHQLNIVTGIPSHGKSTWVDALAVNLAVNHNWRFLVYSPESYPLEIHCLNIIEKYLRKTVVCSHEKDVLRGVAFIEKHFVFVDCSKDDVNLDQILELARESEVNGLIIDPWNELDSDRPTGMSETDYIGRSLKKIRVFSRNNKISTWIVAHPQKLYKDQSGKYNKPTLYDISGSAHWYNKADNGIVIHRGEGDRVTVDIFKIKSRFYGKKGEVELIFNPDFHGYDDVIQGGQPWPE